MLWGIWPKCWDQYDMAQKCGMNGSTWWFGMKASLLCFVPKNNMTLYMTCELDERHLIS